MTRVACMGVVVGALVACAAGPPKNRAYGRLAETEASTTVHAASAVPIAPKRWRVGEWALYRRTSPQGVVFVRFAVFAEDRCGTWIEIVYDAPHQHERLLGCFAGLGTTTQSVRARLYQFEDHTPRQDVPITPNAEYLGSHFVPGSTASITEDVTTPAGRFVGAQRHATGDHESWRHPDAPLGGIVRVVGPRYERVLVASGYSERDGGAEIAQLYASMREPKPRFDRFFAFGASAGTIAGARNATSAAGYSIVMGARVTRRLDFIGANGVDYTNADPDTDEMHLRATLGMRWLPFRQPRWMVRKRFDPTALYLQGGIGYAQLNRSMTTGDEITVHGLAASAALGWIPMQAYGWSIGLELGDRAAFYASGEGVRHDLMLSALVQLYMN